MGKLSQKQLDFCKYVVELNNNTQAAIKAGYSAKTATVMASKLLTKGNVKDEVSRLRAINAKKYEWSRDTAAKVLWEVINNSPKHSDKVAATKVFNEMCGLDEPQKIQHSNDPNNPLSIAVTFVKGA